MCLTMRLHKDRSYLAACEPRRSPEALWKILLPEPLCMFCSAKGSETLFDNGHIIPKSVGGSWEINSCVCRQCNNTLGKDVDVHAWSIPDVVNAHDKLRLPYDANTVFKKHYQAKARMGGREVPFKAEWTHSAFDFTHTRIQSPTVSWSIRSATTGSIFIRT